MATISLDDYVTKALVELRKKSLQQIQEQTALTWAGRACAAAAMGLADVVPEYAHEAIEHAALSGNDSLLAAVRAAFEEYNVEW